MGPLLCSSVEVREPIELQFNVVSGVGPGIDVIDGIMAVHVPQGEGAVSGIFWHGLNGQNDVLFAEKCIRLVCEKLTIFPYRQDTVLLAF